ncbi:hypothetical protein PAHAL_7G248800 [Panicum hallii]|uniref:Uncharacterized protein n=1 Tax=Panicum hallii TaxID=206008 RepID=A0A2T8IDE2_9POAL|nr:hypothetical protein PAHAL_7G248800 [Panicum hallii]
MEQAKSFKKAWHAQTTKTSSIESNLKPPWNPSPSWPCRSRRRATSTGCCTCRCSSRRGGSPCTTRLTPATRARTAGARTPSAASGSTSSTSPPRTPPHRPRRRTGRALAVPVPPHPHGRGLRRGRARPGRRAAPEDLRVLLLRGRPC